MKIKRCIIILSILLFAVSCKTLDNADLVQSTRVDLANGDYDKAVSDIEASQETVYKKEPMLFQYDAGLVNFYAGDYEKAVEHLSNAENQIEGLYTERFSQDVAKYLLNDYAKDYAGEIYEDVVLNSLLSLSYYNLGKKDDAFVEVKKINTKLVDYLLNTEKQEGTLSKIVFALTPNPFVGVKLPDGIHSYNDSALANFISMYMYRASGESDNAYVDFKRFVSSVYFSKEDHDARLKGEKEFKDEDYTNKLIECSAPFSADDYMVPDGKARLNVLTFGGVIAPKVENFIRVEVPVFTDKGVVGTVPAKVAWPEIQEGKNSSIKAVSVKIGDKEYKLDEIENFSDDARNTLFMDFRRTYLRSFYRSAAKVSGSSSAIVTATGEMNIGVRVLADTISKSEKADLRMASFLPESVSAGGITLDPGDYEVNVVFYLDNGYIVNHLYKVSLKAGESELVLSSCVR